MSSLKGKFFYQEKTKQKELDNNFNEVKKKYL